jgi:hypothetical protein
LLKFFAFAFFRDALEVKGYKSCKLSIKGFMAYYGCRSKQRDREGRIGLREYRTYDRVSFLGYVLRLKLSLHTRLVITYIIAKNKAILGLTTDFRI